MVLSSPVNTDRRKEGEPATLAILSFTLGCLSDGVSVGVDLTSIGFSMDHISKETFLFCLKYQDEPLKIVDFKSGFKIQNNELLNTVLNEVGVINIEYWIPNSTDKDKSGDIYLNRIYRAYIHSNDSVDEALNTLLVKYPLLYAENEYIRKPYYQPPNDPSVGNQCSIEAVNADRCNTISVIVDLVRRSKA